MNKKYQRLDALYSKIPKIECKGLCHASCSIVPAAKIEIKRARDRLGRNPFNPVAALKSIKENNGKIPSCGALKNNRCSIYLARPTMCRAYGVAEGLSCSFGCVPKKVISKDDLFNIIKQIEEL